MKVTQNSLAELISYLNALKKILLKAPLDKRIYKEGTMLNQVAFHASQSVLFYLRTYVLNENYTRDREKEYTTNHSLDELQKSIDKALQTCDEVVDKNIDLFASLQKRKAVYSRNFELTTICEVIQHTTAHTAEHYGEITIAINNTEL